MEWKMTRNRRLCGRRERMLFQYIVNHAWTNHTKGRPQRLCKKKLEYRGYEEE